MKKLLLLLALLVPSTASAALPTNWPSNWTIEWGVNSYAPLLAQYFPYSFSCEQPWGYQYSENAYYSNYLYGSIVDVHPDVGPGYFGPYTAGVEATMIYQFETGINISQATLATSFWVDSTSYINVDLSVDNANWSTVMSSVGKPWFSNYQNPLDISSMVAGSSDVWVRIRMMDNINKDINTGYSGAQFARCFWRQPPFAFNAVGTGVPIVPEPSTSQLALVLFMCYMVWRAWT